MLSTFGPRGRRAAAFIAFVFAISGVVLSSAPPIAASEAAETDPSSSVWELRLTPAVLAQAESDDLADLDDETDPSKKPHYDFSSIGVRGGAFTFTSSENRDLFDVMPAFGIDLKHHMPKTWLAGRTSLDFAFGSSSSTVSVPGVGTASVDQDLFAFAWRLTALVEPPPGAWGTPDFYINPYGGGGIGLHYTGVDASSSIPGVLTASGEDSDTEIGLHAVLGIDFVMRSYQHMIAFGVELLWTTTDVGGVGSVTDYGGFYGFATFRYLF